MSMIKKNQDSKEQIAHKRENQKNARQNQEDSEALMNKKLDGPNRPST